MSYVRVLPRDLFNEADLLKCLGRLWIELDNRRDHAAAFAVEDVPVFIIEQDDGSGALSVINLPFVVHGRSFTLSRPLNARSPWPLCLETDEDCVYVFDADGRLSAEMLAFIRAAR